MCAQHKRVFHTTTNSMLKLVLQKLKEARTINTFNRKHARYISRKHGFIFLSKYFTNFFGNIWSVSTAFHTGSQAFISSSKPTLSSLVSLRSNIRGAKPKQLVCKLVMRLVSMSLSPAEIKAKSTRTFNSWVAVNERELTTFYIFWRSHLVNILLPMHIDDNPPICFHVILVATLRHVVQNYRADITQ